MGWMQSAYRGQGWAIPLTSIAAVGTIAAQRMQRSTGTVAVPTDANFAGSARTYALVSPPAGATINASSGVVSVNTGTIAPGTHSLTVRATNEAGQADQPMTVMVGAQVGYSIPTDQFNSWSAAQKDAAMALAVQAQAVYIRVDVHRGDIETSAGAYSWASTDALFAKIQEYGMKPWAILRGTPTTFQIAGATWTRRDLPPDPYSGWYNFCAAFMARYPGIEQVELGNESNHPTFNSSNEDASAYVARQLAPGYLALKTVKPAIQITSSGLSPRPENDGAGSRNWMAAARGAGAMIASPTALTWAVRWGTSTIAHQGGGVYRITNGAAAYSERQIDITTVVGRSYVVQIGINVAGGQTAGGFVRIVDSGGTLPKDGTTANAEFYGTTTATPALYRLTVKARQTTTSIVIGCNTTTNGDYTDFSITADTLWEADIYSVCDAYGDHPYNWAGYQSDPGWYTTTSWMGPHIARQLKSEADAAGKGRPWHATEFGGATQGTNGGTLTPVSLAQHDTMHRDAWDATAGSETWRRVLLRYSLVDRGADADDTESWFGDVGPASEGFSPKPAWPYQCSIRRGVP